ncbi:hypothetical protein [Aeromonas caviae]|uniref:hypothetical protein n=1 Tax=Aeromonas caviae TaxID=648 RepID=UPI00237F1522|nr:hypothetical protein [Aeromonas caviae]WDV27844.1 hypothetical protein PVK35_19100 [Aeromonas caviae]
MKVYLENLMRKELHHNNSPIIGFDFFTECLLLQDKDCIDLIDFIKINHKTIETDFLLQLRFESKLKLESINSKLEQSDLTNDELSGLLLWHRNEICSLHDTLKIKSLGEYISKNKDDAFKTYYHIGVNSITFMIIYAKSLAYDYLIENAIYYEISRVLLNKYKRDFERDNFDYSSLMVSQDIKLKLSTLYGKSPLCKYDLFKIDENVHTIVDAEIPYIADINHPRTYLTINFGQKRIIPLIIKLINDCYAKSVSFKIESVINETLALEDIKYGQRFSLKLDDLPNGSVFYDVNKPDDNFWAFVKKEKDKYSITFEETLEDTFYDKDVNVITNLVHLEVTSKNNVDVISHIDHEYIVYELDTYLKRLNDSSVKGEHKIKTFKIDKSSIPLNYKYENCNVLYLFVHEVMSNKKIVKEYFENLIKEP